VQEVLDATAGRDLPPPNVDFALAALGFVTGMIVGAGETIFAVARTAGWIAHAVEQYSDESYFRARARYVGERPSRDIREPSTAGRTSHRAPFTVPDS
jgi:citrate synthase